MDNGQSCFVLFCFVFFRKSCIECHLMFKETLKNLVRHYRIQLSTLRHFGGVFVPYAGIRANDCSLGRQSAGKTSITCLQLGKSVLQRVSFTGNPLMPLYLSSCVIKPRRVMSVQSSCTTDKLCKRPCACFSVWVQTIWCI